MGHSFGAFVVAWVLRYVPHVVERTPERVVGGREETVVWGVWQLTHLGV